MMLFRALAYVLVLFASCSSLAADEPVRTVYDCAYTRQPPTIDGDLSDAGWSSAARAVIRPLNLPNTPPTRASVTAALLWDDAHLYFSAVIHDDSPVQTHAQRDDRVWEDDCFEIYLNPSGDGSVYYELDINSSGAIWDSMGLPHHRGRIQLIRSWTAASLEAKTQAIDGGWQVEGRVRFDELVGADRVPPMHGDRWPANLFYLDTPLGERVQATLAWNPTDRFNDVSKFGELRFVDYAGEAQRQRQIALGQRAAQRKLMDAGAPLFTVQSSLRPGGSRSGDYPPSRSGNGWRSDKGFGRVTFTPAENAEPEYWRIAPNGGDDATVIQCPAPGDGVLVVLARLTPAAGDANHQAGADGTRLTLGVQDQQATLHPRGAQWHGAALPVRQGQTVRLTLDCGAAGHTSFDITQVIARVVPADALDPRLGEGWSALGSPLLVEQVQDDARGSVLHVVADDAISGARRDLPAVPDARLYRITGWVRSGLRGITRGHVGIDFLDGSGQFLRQASTRHKLEDYLRWGVYNFGGTSEWTRFVTYAYDPPRQATTLRLWLGVNAWEAPDAAGEAWFADVQVQAVNPDESLPLGFPPLRWVDDAPAPRPGRGDFLLSRTPIERYQLPGMPPPVTRDDAELDILAWPGTAAPASFTLHAIRDTRDVQVTVSDLTGKGGAVIASSAVELRRVVYLPRKAGLMTTHEYLLTPTYLEPLTRLEVGSGQSQQCWLTVRVPGDARPGRYEGTLRVTPGHGRARSLRVRLDVLPIEPQTRPDLLAGFYCNYMPDQSPQQLRQIFDDMRDHGMTCAFQFNPNFHLPIERDSTGRAIIRWDQRNQLAELLDTYRDAGFRQTLLMIVPTSILEASRSAGPRFGEVYADLFKQVREEGQRRGWAPFAVVPADEGYPYPYAPSRFELTALSAPALRLAGVPVALHSMNHPTAGGFRFEQQFEHLCDLVLVTTCHAPATGGAYRGYANWDQYRVAMQRQGKRVMIYNPDTTGQHPESMRFIYGVGLWKLQADGVSNWHYRENEGERAYALRRVQGSASMDHVLPAWGSQAGGPTLAWEAAREGNKDYQVLYTLDRLIRSALDSGDARRQALARQAGDEVQALLSRVRFDTIDPVSELTLPRWARRSLGKDDVAQVHGELKIDNGLELADYDRLRHLACRWILALQ
jgi:hypothetical protein